MSQQLHLIFVPGLGDTSDAASLRYQKMAVRSWRRWGVSSELLAMNWSDDELWESKLERLLLRIDTIRANGTSVGLVAASAGAAAVVTAYAARTKDVVGVVTICGKINRPNNIGERYSHSNPALIPAAKACQQALAKLSPKHRQRMQSRRAVFDEVVKKADNYVEGADNRVVPSFGHAFTIATQLLIGAPVFIRFLKTRAE